MDIGTPIWIQHDKSLWIKAKVHATSLDTSSIQAMTETGTIVQVDSHRVKCRNEYAHEDNLTSLAHLHEPSILDALMQRYENDVIYTHIGEILLAINPFKKLKLFTPSSMNKYASNSNDILPPHVYSIAKTAFETMRRDDKNQSILVSGESGAGKTETTKIIMKFLTAIAGQANQQSNISIEQQILQSNPILEAFGNARTLRNDNSSRFGKFIEIQFNDENEITGARIRTYLLERVRLIKHAKGERNFHIFYELLKGASVQEKKDWGIEQDTVFSYLNKKKNMKRKDGVCDRTQFQRTLQAMTDIGISTGQREQILAAIVALLHLGNIEFEDSKTDTLIHLEWAAKLLKVDAAALKKCFLQRKIVAGSDSVQVKLSAEEASNARNALAMAAYGGIFRWLVGRINATIRKDNETEHFIGLLDIFGFEDMKHNSFEQLCINYANEALQQQFNQYVFEQEQEIYKREKIQWDFIDFPNNDKCLELFEGRPLGLFSLLDQECVFPRGTDAGVASKYYKEFDKKRPHFQASPLKRQQCKFVVAHYAGNVCYSTKGFLKKNKDSMYNEAIELFESSTSSFVRKFSQRKTAVDESEDEGSYSDDDDEDDDSEDDMPQCRLRKRYSAIGSTSVGTQFKTQLVELMDIIEDTLPHYVRCIKPNDKNTSNSFDSTRVVEQLRSGGVLEAVRVARAGYPVRIPHKAFKTQYISLLTQKSQPKALRALDISNFISRLLSTVHPNFSGSLIDVGVQIGLTKIFLRKTTYENLEKWRSESRYQAAIMIQRVYKGYFHKRHFQRKVRAAVSIQTFVRCAAARALARFRREIKFATTIQSTVRRYIAQCNYIRLRDALLTIQCAWRVYTACKEFRGRFKTKRIIILQARIRQWMARRHYLSTRQAIIRIQCRIRIRKAKAQVKQRRLESRNVLKLKDENQRLMDELNALKAQMLGKQTAPENATPPEPVVPEKANHSPEEVPESQDIYKGEMCGNNNSAQEDEDAKSAADLLGEAKAQAEEDIQAKLKAQIKAGGKNVDMALVQKLIASQMKRQNMRLQMRKNRMDSNTEQRDRMNSCTSFRRRLDSNRLDSASRRGRMDSNSMRFSNERFLRRESLASDVNTFYGRGPLCSTASSVAGNGVSRWCKGTECRECQVKFSFFIRRHHCRNCGFSFCNEHSTRRTRLPQQGYPNPVRVCDECFEDVMIATPADFEIETHTGTSDPPVAVQL